ncbi:MAG: hypothetical protein JKY46_09215 [Robiginitomaculum sp.]|nr:hypothetical protein [Robiginitomaculum sp.]
MIVVIQCAASKQSHAGSLQREDGTKVLFVAKPELAPAANNTSYACPDDFASSDVTWREELLSYNETKIENPQKLLPAWELYRNPAYAGLVNKFGKEKVYILSAGWGLIAADFLTPVYDITFSGSAEKYKRRGKKDNYADFRMLQSADNEPVIFLGGKDYIPLFCHLTSHLNTKRVVIYNSKNKLFAPGCSMSLYKTTTRTNWHYKCAQAIIDNEFVIT